MSPINLFLDTSFYKASAVGISDTILMGRAIVDAHRKRKGDSYQTVMTHQDRVVTNVDRLMDMRRKLQVWGFKDESDLIRQSTAADIKAGLAEKDRWR